MQRRAFIKNMASVMAMGSVSGGVLAASLGKSTSATVAASVVNIKEMFNAALAQDPYLIGMANIDSDFSRSKMAIEGKLPSGLTGLLVRNGPGKNERANVRYQHWFEGDGMVQQFEIADGEIHHHGKFLRTPKFVEEDAAKRFLYSGPDTKLPYGKAVSNPGYINVANTNVIPVNGDLWALWEAGAPTAIDHQSLAFKQQVNLGEGNQYGAQLKGLPFSAHPKIDPNGDIWNFGLSPRGDIVLYHLNSNGSLKQLGMLRNEYDGGMLHDFLITHKHIVLILPSITRNRHKSGYFSATEFDSDKPMRVIVVDKNTLKAVRRYDLPAAFAFHFGNAWEDTHGQIQFDASLYENLDVLHEKSAQMAGKHIANPANGYTTLFTLKPDGSANSHRFDAVSEFPRVCPHLTGLRNQLVFHISAHESNIWSHQIMSRNIETGQADRFDYGDEYIVEEHIPVCPAGDEAKSYLIGTALHVPSKRTCLNVFNMHKLSDGPMARAWLPYHLPLGFHGNFVQLS